jgi:mono/diheme cytochrome c family protein
MDNHGHDHGGKPEPREFSNPVLWTVGLIAIMGALAWVFFHYLHVGVHHVQGEPKFAMPSKGAAGPDHAALIADRSPEVLDRGEIVYGKNCASCHGPTGDSNPNNIKPEPRHFRTEGMKNPLGDGPYAWYKVLTDGYGAAMPAFRSLTPADRYAVTHFIRERWIKPANAPFYVENDKDEVAKQIPAAGSAGASEAKVDLAKIVPPPAVYGVMARAAAGDSAARSATVAWLKTLTASADALDAPLVARLNGLAEQRPADADRLLAIARTGTAAELAAALAASPDPVLALARAADLNRLAVRLIAAAAVKG